MTGRMCGITITFFSVATRPGSCVYKGVFYRHGEHWYDGCDLSCVCEDGFAGIYTCKERLYIL